MVLISSAKFYHSEKLQSTKTKATPHIKYFLFYHSEKLQSTKTVDGDLHTGV